MTLQANQPAKTSIFSMGALMQDGHFNGHVYVLMTMVMERGPPRLTAGVLKSNDRGIGPNPFITAIPFMRDDGAIDSQWLALGFRFWLSAESVLMIAI